MERLIRYAALALISGSLVLSSASGAQLLSPSQISTTASGLAYSRVTQTFTGTVTITDISGAAINGPFQIVFSSLTANVTLMNATGVFGGNAYLTVPNVTSLSAGQSATVSIQFSDPSDAKINFTPVIYGGSFVTFSITRLSNPPDAISGHAYAVYIATSLASGNAAGDVVTACSLSGSGVPSGMTAAPGTLPGSGGAAYYCVVAMPSASAPGQYTFTLQATDNSFPRQNASQSYALGIRPDFVFTTAALAQGVQGRSYGVAPLSQPEATNIGGTQGGLTIGNAPLTGCAFVSVTPSNPGLSVGLDSTKTQCLLSSAALTATGTFGVTVSATETQIIDPATGVVAVPAAATTPVASTLSLVANPPLTLAVNRGSSWPTAVSNRPYGSGTGCTGTGGACLAAIYTATGGLGGYLFPATTPASMPSGLVCPAVSGSATYTCSAPVITAVPGTYNPSITVTDAGNTATPGGSQSLVSTLTINPEMNFTGTPGATLVQAVTGRTYGVGNTCGAVGTAVCTPLTYTIQSGSGLGGYNYAFLPSIGFTCSNGLNTTNCTSASVGAAGTYNTVNVSVTDTSNASTPSNTIASTNNATLTVDAPLTLTPPPSFPDFPAGENNVTYGSASSGCATRNAACTPLTFSVPFVNPTIEGLPPYMFTPSGFPANLNCIQSNAGAPAPNGTILTCSATTGISATGPFPQAFTPSVQVTDTPNASVPAETASSGPASLTVEPQLSILDTVLPNGLVGFQYYPSGLPGVTIKSQGGIGSTTWVGPGDGASGACPAPAATLPGITAMTFDSASQRFSSATAFVAADASTIDGTYTFQVCVTDTGNAATPHTAALPNPGATAPLVANNFVFDVLNTYAYVAETSAEAVGVINTATSEVVGSGIFLGVGPTAHPNGVAVSPDGARAYVTLSNNKFAVIDTITNTQITNSPFAMPAGSTCTSLAGVAITNDGRAYFACPTSSGTGGRVDVVSIAGNADNATLIAELATGNAPSGVAISPTVDATSGKTSQVYVGLNDVNELVIIANSATPAVSTTVNLNTLNTAPLGLAAVVAGSNVYVYLAKTGAGTGNPGIEVVNATTASQVSDFAFFPSTRIPVGAAASPDGSEVYVTLNDSTLGASYVSVIDNTSPPALRSAVPYGLPDPTVVPPPADTGAAGIAIPPSATSDFLIWIPQSISHDVAVLLDNRGAGNKPLVQPAVTLNGTTPQGIANIPVPSVIPKLP